MAPYFTTACHLWNRYDSDRIPCWSVAICRCKCKALSKYRLSKLEPEERRMQRAFLKEHTTADWRQHKPRFLKTVAGSAGRFKRKALSVHPAAATAVTDGGDGSVLRDVAEDELEQVELIMEDISDEIFDLEVSCPNLLLVLCVEWSEVTQFNIRPRCSWKQTAATERLRNGVSPRLRLHPAASPAPTPPVRTGWAASFTARTASTAARTCIRIRGVGAPVATTSTSRSAFCVCSSTRWRSSASICAKCDLRRRSPRLSTTGNSIACVYSASCVVGSNVWCLPLLACRKNEKRYENGCCFSDRPCRPWHRSTPSRRRRVRRRWSGAVPSSTLRSTRTRCPRSRDTGGRRITTKRWNPAAPEASTSVTWGGCPPLSLRPPSPFYLPSISRYTVETAIITDRPTRKCRHHSLSDPLSPRVIF